MPFFGTYCSSNLPCQPYGRALRYYLEEVFVVQILKLTGNGIPQGWLTLEEAVLHYAAGEVIWELGQEIATLHGGNNAISGLRSQITVNSIIGVAGFGKVNPFDVVPLLTNDKLFRRDKNICGY